MLSHKSNRQPSISDIPGTVRCIAAALVWCTLMLIALWADLEWLVLGSSLLQAR